MYIRNRSIPMIIILSLVTCGIYGLIWLYQTSQEVSNTLGDGDSSGLEVLLCVITCGLYTIYWWYKYSKKLVLLSQKMGAAVTDNSLICLLLSVFGLGIISMGIMQSQINDLAGFVSNGQA